MSIRNVAVVGAGGRCGRFITEALLRGGQHTVTAITRAESTSELPAGVTKIAVDYSNHAELVAALKGQDALVITLAVTARDAESQLLKAATEANVAWILPNEWGMDSRHPGLVKDIPFQAAKAKFCEEIQATGASYMAIITGFWYSWSLGLAEAFGVDLVNRKVTFFDDGMIKIDTSTWQQIGRTVAALLSLPAEPVAGGNPKKCLAHFKNAHVHINSFNASQKDMFESALRVTGTQASEWTIVHEPSKDRYATNMAAGNAGDRMAFMRAFYARVFFPDGAGGFGARYGLDNELLGLPHEAIDEATKEALQRAKTNPFA